MLPPLGILFGLFVAFTAVQVWNDNDRAKEAVDREASALRAVVILGATFPGEPQARLRALIRRYIEEAVTQEWPMMAHQTATLNLPPRHLFEALQLTLALTPSSPGQQAAEREMVTELEAAFDARRQRIIISRAQVHFVKWACLFIQAICALFAIALVHSDNRLAATITIGIFATGVAVCVLLIASYDRPFVGQLSIQPDPLLQGCQRHPNELKNSGPVRQVALVVSVQEGQLQFLILGPNNWQQGEAAMTRKEAIQNVSYQVDDAHNRREARPDDVNSDDRLVGWHQGLETLFVAVRSHVPGVKLTDEVAKTLARDYLTEIGWFGEESLEADFVF